MMKPLSEHYIVELIKQAQDYLLKDSKHMAALCLDIAGKRAVHFEAATAMWKGRAVREARRRIQIAKEKNRLEALNKELGRRANNNFNDWLKARGIIRELESRLEETTKMGEELIDERDEIIGHLEADLAHEREKVTFLDASLNVKQRLVVAEATLAAIRERVERIHEGESWDLLDFILKKTAVHAPECWKNQAFRGLGVGGPLASCTCGAEKN